MKKIIRVFVAIFIFAILSYTLIYHYNYSNYNSKKSVNIVVETVVDNFFKDLQDGNLENASKYLDLNSKYNNFQSKLNNNTYKDLFKEIFSKIQYKIEAVNVKESTATVKMQIESVDLLSFYNKYFNELSPFIKSYLSGDEKEKVQAKNGIKTFLLSRVEVDIQKGNYEKFIGTAKINLVKKDEKWIIEADDDLIYYLTGKMTALMNK